MKIQEWGRKLSSCSNSIGWQSSRDKVEAVDTEYKCKGGKYSFLKDGMNFEISEVKSGAVKKVLGEKDINNGKNEISLLERETRVCAKRR